MAQFGRHPDALHVMPGVSPITAKSQAEAEDKFHALQELIHPAVGLFLLSNLIGYDLSQYSPDDYLPEMPVTSGAQGRQQVLVDMAQREHLTIGQLYKKAIASRGHWQPVGTAETVADLMEEHFLNEGADGFNLMTQSPTDLADFGR